MKQIEKTEIIKRMAKKAKNDKTGFLNCFNRVLKDMLKRTKSFLKKYRRKELNDFLFQIALTEIYIDQIREEYGTEIESLKVLQLSRIKKELDKEDKIYIQPE